MRRRRRIFRDLHGGDRPGGRKTRSGKCDRDVGRFAGGGTAEADPEAPAGGQKPWESFYTTSEANSLYAIAQYQQLAGDYGFTIDAVAVTTQSEVTQALDKLLSDGVDCLSNLTDNNVVGVLPAILEKPMRQAFRCMAPRSNRLSWDASPERGLIMSSSESRPAKWPPGSAGGGFLPGYPLCQHCGLRPVHQHKSIDGAGNGSAGDLTEAAVECGE